MTAAENIRAYLTARSAAGITSKSARDIGVIDACRGRQLTEADLEVVLQMVDILADVLSSIVTYGDGGVVRDAAGIKRSAEERIIGPPPSDHPTGAGSEDPLGILPTPHSPQPEGTRSQ